MPDPTDLTPVTIPLDPADRDAYRAADLAWRTAKIRSIDAERQRASLDAAKASALTIAAAAKTRDDEDTAAKAQAAAKLAVQATVLDKAGHAATPFTDVGYEPTTGNLVCKREPLLQGTPRAVVKTLKMTDAQATAFVASYLRGIAASHAHADLQRQMREYEAAHPDQFTARLIQPGEPKEPAPLGYEVYEALQVELEAQAQAQRDEMVAQGAIFAAVTAGEKLDEYGGYRMNTNGTIELTEMPPPEAPKVIEEVKP